MGFWGWDLGGHSQEADALAAMEEQDDEDGDAPAEAPAGPEPVVPAPAYEPLREITLDDVLHHVVRLNMSAKRVGTAWRFHRGATEQGRIHVVGLGIKATCGRHKDCICYVSCPPGADRKVAVFEDLFVWIVSDESQPAHANASRAIRRDKYHMKIRS